MHNTIAKIDTSICAIIVNEDKKPQQPLIKLKSKKINAIPAQRPNTLNFVKLEKSVLPFLTGCSFTASVAGAPLVGSTPGCLVPHLEQNIA